MEDAKAELAWLDAEEEARRLEKKLAGDKEGLRKLRLFCQSKAREEIACREEAVARCNCYKKLVYSGVHSWGQRWRSGSTQE